MPLQRRSGYARSGLKDVLLTMLFFVEGLILEGLKLQTSFMFGVLDIILDCFFYKLTPKSQVHLFSLSISINIIRKIHLNGHFFLINATPHHVFGVVANLNSKFIKRLYFLIVVVVVYVI